MNFERRLFEFVVREQVNHQLLDIETLNKIALVNKCLFNKLKSILYFHLNEVIQQIKQGQRTIKNAKKKQLENLIINHQNINVIKV